MEAAMPKKFSSPNIRAPNSLRCSRCEKKVSGIDNRIQIQKCDVLFHLEFCKWRASASEFDSISPLNILAFSMYPVILFVHLQLFFQFYFTCYLGLIMQSDEPSVCHLCPYERVTRWIVTRLLKLCTNDKKKY